MISSAVRIGISRILDIRGIGKRGGIAKIVTSVFGCVDSIYGKVRITPEFRFFIPNAFTPNGDGKNDSFMSNNMGVREFNMTIYNRWGNIIFQTTDPKTGWNGKARGSNEIAENGVYVYKIELQSVFYERQHFIGTVTLVR